MSTKRLAAICLALVVLAMIARTYGRTPEAERTNAPPPPEWTRRAVLHGGAPSFRRNGERVDYIAGPYYMSGSMSQTRRQR